MILTAMSSRVEPGPPMQPSCCSNPSCHSILPVDLASRSCRFTVRQKAPRKTKPTPRAEKAQKPGDARLSPAHETVPQIRGARHNLRNFPPDCASKLALCRHKSAQSRAGISRKNLRSGHPPPPPGCRITLSGAPAILNGPQRTDRVRALITKAWKECTFPR